MADPIDAVAWSSRWVSVSGKSIIRPASIGTETWETKVLRTEQLKRLDGIATILATTAARDSSLLGLLADDAVLSDRARSLRRELLEAAGIRRVSHIEARELCGIQYRSQHLEPLRRRADWFVPMAPPHLAMWWVPVGHHRVVETVHDTLTAQGFTVAAPLLAGALAFGVLTAVLLTTLGSHRRVGDDAALAILLTSFFSLGVVLISRTRGFTADLTVFLFGRVLAVDRADLLQTLALAAVVAATLWALRKELVLRAFDPEATAAMGYRTRVLDLVLNLLIALVVVAAVEAVGTVLVIALIVVPAAAARLLTDRVAAMTALACLLGAAGGWLGLAVSYEVSVDHNLRLAAGATIVVVLVSIFVALFFWLEGVPRLAILPAALLIGYFMGRSRSVSVLGRSIGAATWCSPSSPVAWSLRAITCSTSSSTAPPTCCR